LKYFQKQLGSEESSRNKRTLRKGYLAKTLVRESLVLKAYVKPSTEEKFTSPESKI